MKVESRKLAIYEELVHGDSIKLNDLYNTFLPCSVKTGQTHLSEDIYFIHDISDLGLAYKTLLLSTTQLPILTTSNTQTLISTYNEKHHQIFQKVMHTVNLYYERQQKRYKQPMIDKQCVFIPLNGSVRKDTSFINLMYVDNFHRVQKMMTTINFANFLGIDIEYDVKIFETRVQEALTQYVLYFYPDSFELIDDSVIEKGKYLKEHLHDVACVTHSIDGDKLMRCRNKVDYYLSIQKIHQTLSINEFIEEYDSYWDKI